METIYITVFQLIVGTAIFLYFEMDRSIFIYIIFLIVTGISMGNRPIFYRIIPVFLIISWIFFVDASIYKKGDFLNQAQVRIYEGKGKVEKIEKKYPTRPIYLNTMGVPDGLYRLSGEIEKISNKSNYSSVQLKIEEAISLEKPDLKSIFTRYNLKLLENSTNEQKNLFLGVISGERERIFPRIKKLFSKSGLSHLLAISGMHLGILIILMEFFIKKLPLYKRQRNLTILLGITLYYLAVRSSPSLERAYMMAVIYYLGNIFWENSDIKKSLLISFVISLLFNPLIIKELSFILSYSAMAVILYVIPWIKKFRCYLIGKYQVKLNIFYQKGIFVAEYILFVIILQTFLSPVVLASGGEFSAKTVALSILLTPVGTVYIFLAFFSLILPIMPITNMWYNFFILCLEFFNS